MQVPCTRCGKESYRRPSHAARVKRLFCSHVCRAKWTSEQSQITLTCVACKTKFKRRGYKKDQKHCSRTCMGKERSGEKSPRWNSVTKKCLICKKEFTASKSTAGFRKTCSYECGSKLHSVRMSGSGNSNWQNGIGKLPWAWEFNNKLKEQVRARDNQQCRLCHINRSELPKGGWGLAIHHIDYDKQNNNPSNLISLCNRCHGKTHYQREKWKQKLSALLNGSKTSHPLSTT